MDVLSVRGKYKLPEYLEDRPFMYSLMVRELLKKYPADKLEKFEGKVTLKRCLARFERERPGNLKELAIIGAETGIYKDIDHRTVATYIDLCWDQKVKPYHSIATEKMMLDTILDIKHRKADVKMTVATVFKRLESRLGEGYRLLQTTEEVIKEDDLNPDHIIRYINSVNRKRCGIFTVDADGHHYHALIRYSTRCGYFCEYFYCTGDRKSWDTDEAEKQEEILAEKLSGVNEDLREGRLKSSPNSIASKLYDYQFSKMREMAKKIPKRTYPDDYDDYYCMMMEEKESESGPFFEVESDSEADSDDLTV